MALFGTTKKDPSKKLGAGKKGKKAKIAHKHVARTTKLAAGVANDIIRAPWFSEKALIATEKGVYTFAVPVRATKASITSAIKEIYNVAPRMVRIVNLPGKTKALRTRRGTGTRAMRRKAYVYLNKGDSIQFA